MLLHSSSRRSLASSFRLVAPFTSSSSSTALFSLVTSQRRAYSEDTHQVTATSAKPKRVIFSGIQPTGIPHLGNYFGALQRWVQQQNEADADTANIYSLVDLHAITVKQNPKQLRQWRKESLAVLLAVGLDPKKSTIFFQSHVPAHSELMWILSCTASVGYLSRMTQWKSKLALEDNAKPFDTPLQLGLFSYPVLQAADILVHRATHVPVGEDQCQHLEFARECAAAFNRAYGKVFVEPATVLSPAKRIMSLTNPTKKMSKSDLNEKSRILITDDSAIIKSKVNKAITDSEDAITFDPATRPGLSNLLQLLFYAEGRVNGGPDELAKELQGASKRAIKERTSKAIDGLLRPVRERYEEIIQNDKYLEEVAEVGAEKARKSAAETMKLVKEAVGF
ncbi:tryptophan-tRNA ligase [Verruconis gallopava]|uniref:Tryptophan--tRNA ligase, mitochondrial n=1 Tax=Verruconis gallopava TaxID=253628 RepID=A0A0D2ANI7_9PEZI|nr:tryptophan-tRNA ligase [Verruconis gallopava]KIW00704.1 tryptophan-tRNA ligase [Verruconis gallopava]